MMSLSFINQKIFSENDTVVVISDFTAMFNDFKTS